MTQRFYMVDVFAESIYSGNQLAVIVGSEYLSVEMMQKIAAEMNFSETTFVMSSPEDDGGYRVRIFTPAREIEFTGHPILGSAWVIRHHIADETCTKVQMNLAVGKVTATFETSSDGREVVWFRAPSISLKQTSSCEPIATALGISPQDIDTNYPIQLVAAGTSAMLVPLRSLDALRRSKLNLEAYDVLANKGFPPLVYLFCRETYQPENDLSVRFFFEAHGVREDPATGNGASFLGAYLLEHQFFPDSDLSLRIEQGYEVRRPSLIMLRARMINEEHEVSVGGYVIPTVQGEVI